MENRCSLDFSTEIDDYMCETELYSGELSPGEFDFLGRIPVSLKYTFKDGLEAVLKKHRVEKMELGSIVIFQWVEEAVICPLSPFTT
ncbi:hypothetical protein ASJ81_17530 [Methanosarcina spelaei]|uniref:Uncharacterized protein n=1 Tax=Methanosarcina spelaei TaxID=1036679 RepID=A0A2A2HVV0_9EURY|nr:hypothetical protein [Methanosarcina spelaei]PAV13522.1 hypothetical protein ASJ81_17530 [Methanosarcina spelaei]